MSIDVKERILKTILDNKLIDRGDHIVTGLSGGPDSVCLFSVLMELREELGFTLEAVHVNHMFRPGLAEEDARYVQRLCDESGIVCRQYVYDCPSLAEESGRTLEETGRDVRYEAFDDAASASDGNVKIAVAQNAGDQCETMLFRLIRGTGPDGLAAMAYSRRSRKGYDIIRPLLDVRRTDIEAYCAEKNLHPRTDHTNSDREYTRNRIRLDLIPYIEENFSENFTDSLLRLSSILHRDREYLRNETVKARKGIEKDGGVLADRLTELPYSLSSRIVMDIAAGAGLAEDMSMVHIRACLDIAEKGRTSIRTDLPGGYEAAVQYGVFRIRRKGKVPDEQGVVLKAVFDRDRLISEFGTDKVVVRTRKPGDYIRLAGGRKKIKKLFIDMKIPEELRDSIRLAAIGNEVLWVAGYRYSSEYRATDETSSTVEIEIIV